MSSAGTIFDEQIVTVTDSSAADSKSFEFLIENDGFLITIERLSGTGTITGTLYSELPDPMSEVKLKDIDPISTTAEPAQYAFVSHKCNRIDLAWDGPVKFKIVVKSLGGLAVSLKGGNSECVEVCIVDQTGDPLDIGTKVEEGILSSDGGEVWVEDAPESTSATPIDIDMSSDKTTVGLDLKSFNFGSWAATWTGATGSLDGTIELQGSLDDDKYNRVAGQVGVTDLAADTIPYLMSRLTYRYFRFVYKKNGNTGGTLNIRYLAKSL